MIMYVCQWSCLIMRVSENYENQIFFQDISGGQAVLVGGGTSRPVELVKPAHPGAHNM